MPKWKPQMDDGFLSVLHILGQEIVIGPQTEAKNGQLHCMTILGMIKAECYAMSLNLWVLIAERGVLITKCWALSAKCWVLSAECWVLSAGHYKLVYCPYYNRKHIACSPKTEAINWHLNCLTILRMIKTECLVLSAGYYKINWLEISKYSLSNTTLLYFT